MAYGFAKVITIDHTKCGTVNTTDFPFCFFGTYAYLKVTGSGGNVTNSNGYDIILSSTNDLSGSGIIDFEIESYTSTTGAIVLWARIPTLSHSADTVLYLLYGNSGVTTSQENIASVWDSSFKHVNHFKNVANPITFAPDSTSNGNDLDNSAGSVGTGVNIFGGLCAFTSSATNLLYHTPTSNLPLLATPRTIECWFQHFNGIAGGIFAYGTGAGGGDRFVLYRNTDADLYVETNGGGAGAAYTWDSNWHHLAAVLPNGGGPTDIVIYIDGVSIGASSVGGGVATSALYITVFNVPGLGSSGSAGYVAETRISSVVRSVSYFLAQYNNGVAGFFSVDAGTTPLSVTKADSVNNIADAIALLNQAAAHYGLLSSDRLNLVDGITVIGGAPDYGLFFSEALNIRDSAFIGDNLKIIVADTVNLLSDIARELCGIPIQAFDSNQFNWGDTLVTQYLAPLSELLSDALAFADDILVVRNAVRINITITESINLLSDALSLQRSLQAIIVNEVIVVSDAVSFKLATLLKLSENMQALLENVALAKTSRPAFSDSVNNLGDAVSLGLTAQLSLTKGDQLSFSDAVATEMPGTYQGGTDRIRRYLNDVN